MSLVTESAVLSAKIEDLISEFEELEPKIDDPGSMDHLNEAIEHLNHAQFHIMKI